MSKGNVKDSSSTQDTIIISDTVRKIVIDLGKSRFVPITGIRKNGDHKKYHLIVTQNGSLMVS